MVSRTLAWFPSLRLHKASGQAVVTLRRFDATSARARGSRGVSPLKVNQFLLAYAE